MTNNNNSKGSDNDNNNDDNHGRSCISLTIPEGAEEGDVLSFSVGGQELEIPVPIGSKPGDVLQLQIGNNDTENDGQEKEENHQQQKGVMQVDLGKDRIMELALQLPQDLQDATVHKNAADMTSCQDVVDDGTYALPWQSGKELSKIWKEIIILPSFDDYIPRRILELGSGALGLVGLSFCVTLQETLLLRQQQEQEQEQESKSKPIVVVLTDVPSAMPLLQYNLEHVQKNQGLLSSDSLSVQAKPLQWSLDRSPQDDNEYYDCLLGSDLLYNVQFIPHLVATTKRLLHPTRGIFILAVRWRKPELEREFFQESGLEWKLLIPESSKGNRSLPCPLDWKEFGDPTNEKSNLYFHQTQISVHGKPKALADITEEESAKLLADEFEAWDRAHIQIYMGTQPKAT